jgi:hypothetical protein
MSAVQALKLEDADGSVMLVTRVEDLAYTLVIAPMLDEAGNPLPFRMFEDDRRKLKDFLRSLDG